MTDEAKTTWQQTGNDLWANGQSYVIRSGLRFVAYHGPVSESFSTLTDAQEWCESMRNAPIGETDDPTCPHCGKTSPDWSEAVLRDYYRTSDDDGDEHNIECPHCRKRYIVSVHVRETYTSRIP